MNFFVIAFIAFLGSNLAFAGPTTYMTCGPLKGYAVHFKQEGKGNRATYTQTLQVKGEKGELELNCRETGAAQRGANLLCTSGFRKGYLVLMRNGGYTGNIHATVYNMPDQERLAENMFCDRVSK